MPSSLPRRVAVGLVVCSLAMFGGAIGPATASSGSSGPGGDGEDRIEVDAHGVCGRASRVQLSLRVEDGRIRIEMEVFTAQRGLWRVAVFHERRLVARLRVRSTRVANGFDYYLSVPDYEGPDAVWVRAVAPRGETCSAGATVSGS